MNVNGKHVLVCGMARSGKLLLSLGAQVTITDTKPEADFGGALDELRAPGCVFALGQAADALIAGQDMMIISPGIAWAKPFVQSAIAQGVEVMGELELGARLTKGALVAITGTNGKTTTTTLVGELFRAAGRTTHVVGNIGYPFTACALQCGEEDVAVAEVSSFQLETITTFHPHIAVMCNITEDHLNRHGTMEEYIRVKERIFENMGQGDYAVLNLDDPIVRGMAERIPCAPAFFSRRQEVETGAYLEGEEVVFSLNGHKKRVLRADEIRIPGEHNLENALAATALAMLAGVPAPVVRHTLRAFQGVEHRLEFVRELDGVRYINDSKGTNVDSTLWAVRSMTAPTVIILGGSYKKADYHPLGRELMRGNITHAVLIGDTADAIEAALKDEGFTRCVRAGYDFPKAIATARSLAAPGGNVLLSPACASFDMFTDYEARGREFKRIVKDLEPNMA